MDIAAATGQEVAVGFTRRQGERQVVGLRACSDLRSDRALRVDERPGAWQLVKYDSEGNPVEFSQLSRTMGDDGAVYSFSVIDGSGGDLRLSSPDELGHQIALLGRIADAHQLALIAEANRAVAVPAEAALAERTSGWLTRAARAVGRLVGAHVQIVE
ncbi:MAG TPA: hypothetical protein VLF71_01690 [Candidatus Saccharimonadales bacterium]|nr:hypothetical protein [Candidatus Saccharimonadales bacterium]